MKVDGFVGWVELDSCSQFAGIGGRLRDFIEPHRNIGHTAFLMCPMSLGGFSFIEWIAGCARLIPDNQPTNRSYFRK